METLPLLSQYTIVHVSFDGAEYVVAQFYRLACIKFVSDQRPLRVGGRLTGQSSIM